MENTKVIVLKMALAILNEAEESSSDFHLKYGGYLRATGESSADYSLYEIELLDDYYLIIDFVDFSVRDFSLVCKSLERYITHKMEQDEAEN